MKDTTKVAALLAELKAQMTTWQEREIVLNCEMQLNVTIDEEWRDIEGGNGRYKVSNMGNLIRKYPTGWRPLHPKATKFNYKLIGLTLNGERKFHTVHILVAKAFVPNPDNKPTVDHINGNKLDNRACNLRWATRKEQIQYAMALGLKGTGVNHPMAKLTEADVRYIRENCKRRDKEYSIAALAKKFNMSPSDISSVVNGKYFKDIK